MKIPFDRIIEVEGNSEVGGFALFEEFTMGKVQRIF